MCHVALDPRRARNVTALLALPRFRMDIHVPHAQPVPCSLTTLVPGGLPPLHLKSQQRGSATGRCHSGVMGGFVEDAPLAFQLPTCVDVYR